MQLRLPSEAGVRGLGWKKKTHSLSTAVLQAQRRKSASAPSDSMFVPDGSADSITMGKRFLLSLIWSIWADLHPSPELNLILFQSKQAHIFSGKRLLKYTTRSCSNKLT